MRDLELGKKGIAAIMLMSSLTVMVGNAVSPALPALGVFYGLGNYASWLVTAPALGVVAATSFFGRLIDKKGPYTVGVIGLFLYGILGVIGAYMPTAGALFADRFFLGVATAAIMNASVALISQFFQGEGQLKIMALQGISMELGGVIFLCVSGMLADITWRGSFYIYGLGFVAFLGLLFFVPGRGQGEKQPSASLEKDSEVKGIPIPLLLLTAFLGMLMFFTAMVSLPLYLQNALGYRPGFTGFYLGAIDVFAVAAAALMPEIVRRIKEKGCLMVAFCCYGIGFLLYFYFRQLPLLWAAALFVGFGFGFSTPLFNHMTVNKSTAKNRGRNISLCTMAMFFGQFFSAFLVSVFSQRILFLVAALGGFFIMIGVLPIAKRYSS